MDYDDNDFHCQNFQLVGEDNNKFPPSLRSVPLPKFDLDEHLQVHLRFDSLVETEALLGIQGRGDNWIEDFSPGGSAIEFSSTAAESCSISRHTNVWSEATSSESVEMLLKSVGEDEMIDQKAIIKEADAHNGSNDMDGHMDTCLRQNNTYNTKMEDIVHPDTSLSPDKCQKSFLGLKEDAVRVQPQVEDTSRTSNDEKSGIDMDVSSLGEKLNSEGKIVVNQCNMDKNLTSSDYETNKSLVTDETICEATRNDNRLHDAFMKKCATDDHFCIASAVAGDDSDSIICSTQDNPSSVSTSNLVMGLGKSDTQMPSEQVIEEYSEIDISEKVGQLSAQKESSCIIDSKVNDPPFQGPIVRSGPCSAKGSSILEPIMDSLVSLVSLNEGRNDTVFTENPDGLLEAITDQVKAMKEESQTIDKIASVTKERYTLAMAGDRNIEKNSVEISNEDIADLSRLTGLEKAGYGGLDHPSKGDAIHVQSTLSIENSNMVDSYEGSGNRLVEVIEDTQDPEVQLTENISTDVGNTSQSIVEVHSSIDMSHAMPMEETKYDDGLQFNLLNVTSQPNSIVIPKYAEDEVVEDIVKKPEVKLNEPQEDILEESPSPALVDDAEKTPSSRPSKSFDLYDVNKLVAEPYDVHRITPEVSTFTKVSTMPPIISDIANSNDTASIAKEKMQDAPSTGHKTFISTVIDCSPAKKLIQDESVAGPASVGATLATVVIVEQKESTPTLPASGFIQPDETEVEIFGSTILNSNLDAQVSRESIEVSDSVVVDDSSMKDMIHDEQGVNMVPVNSLINFQQSESDYATTVDVVVEPKEEVTSDLPVSDFIHSDEKKIKLWGPDTLSGSGKDSPVFPTEIRPIVVEQSSSLVEGSVNAECQNELQSSIDNPVTHEHPTLLEWNLAHASVKGKGNSGSSGENKETALITSESASNDERQALPIPTPSRISSSGDCQNRQQSSEANVAPGDNCHRQNDTTQIEGDALNRCTNSSPSSPESLTMTGTAESHKLEAESANPSSFKQKCGSPTVISDSGHSQDQMFRENNREPPDRRDSLSDDLLFVSSETSVNDDKLKCNAHDSKESTASEDDKSFTFEVGSLEDLPERDTGNEWKPFSSMRSFELPQTSKENSVGRVLESDEGELHDIITLTPDEDNTRHVSGCSTEKPTTSPGKVAKETPNPKNTTERDGNLCSTSPKSVETIQGNLPMDEMQHCPYIENNLRASCTTTVQTSSLPDLNTSVSAAALFHQPFTDLQQVQLRAQIFVYGSLIQGIPPDEACMISAFGEADGGRSYWEGVWRVSAERCQNQKSPFSSFETPSHSLSGTRVSEQVTWCSSLQSKASSIPASRSGSKVVSTAILNSTLSLPSPLWSISTRDGSHSNLPRVTHLDFNQALSPLHSHQSSQIRQYTGHNASWLSQSPRPGTWVSSHSPPLDVTAQYSALPVAETVHVTPVRDSSKTHATNVQLVSPTALLPTPGPTSVSAASVVQIGTPRKTTTLGINRSASTVQKSRKKKKGSVPEELQPNILLSQPLAEPATSTGDTKHSPSISAGLPISANSPAKVAFGSLVSATSSVISPTYYKIIGTDDTENRAIFSEETCSKIEQAKQLAEDAAALAASAVMHSQGIWSRLATHKNSGLVSEVGERLASAAVAAAAAASVAKAAAAAAKVASDAALQAKMMADEALLSVNTRNLTNNSEIGLLDMGKSLSRITPVSILKGKDKVHCSSSIISAAREAARRRLGAASAATKRAENLDAIVKAAELAAEAVSQAGTIISMGEPLPFTLSELVEAGPEGHWKVHQSTTNELVKTNSLPQEENTSLDVSDNRDKYVEKIEQQSPNNKETQKTTDEERVFSFSEHSVQSEKLYKGNGSGNASSTVPTDSQEKDHSANSHKENSIKKGSLVEVLPNEDGLRGIWFSAHVLDMNDGKAYVCYNDHLPDEGTGQLKQWISLEGEGNKAPRIRLAHPMTAAKYEGTRKRRREAIGNYVWAVGDRVDAWILDGWREGIVTERSQGDDTKLTVHFPAVGDSSIVRAWNLRPSLVWKDGQWLEWSRAREPYEGDTPQEKRQKLGGLEAIDTEVGGKVIGELSKILPVEDPRKPEESRPLILSAKDRVFSIGKNARGENNSDALKLRRTGMQKGGSRVVFGVPKPGKKRKFMEVSKQYVADKADKISEGKDSIKFAKYLMPQTSRAWRSTSKVDPKGKIVGDSKPKMLKSVKSQSTQTRSIGLRDNSSVTTASNGGESGHSSSRNTRAGFSNEQNHLEKKTLMDVGPFANHLGKIESSHEEPSGRPVPGFPSKKSSSAFEVDLGIKGKLTPSVDKSTKSEEVYENPGKTISDAPEPRRSNRRIQPTSRLLEGLQSSLIVSKIPNFSHDKGTKTQHRVASSRGNTHG